MEKRANRLIRGNIILILLLIVMPSFAQKKLRVTPQWLPQAQFAGLFVAIEKGFYSAEGLDIELIFPNPDKGALEIIENKQTDIISQLLLQAIIHNDTTKKKMVNILQTSCESSMTIALKKPVTNFRQLNGKVIGRWQVGGFSELGFLFEKNNNINIEWVPYLQDVYLFSSNIVDGLLTTYYTINLLCMETSLTMIRS